jgi:hypothetical protein
VELLAIGVMIAGAWWVARREYRGHRGTVEAAEQHVCVWTIGLRLEDETGRTVDPEQDRRAFNKAELVRPVTVYQCRTCRRVRDG